MPPSVHAPPSGFGRSSPASSSPVAAAAAWTSTLMGLLWVALAPVSVSVSPTEAHGPDGRAKEAIAFALLADDALGGLPTNVLRATGGAHPVILGKVTPPGGT